jgi:hypothetical protein
MRTHARARARTCEYLRPRKKNGRDHPRPLAILGNEFAGEFDRLIVSMAFHMLKDMLTPVPSNRTGNDDVKLPRRGGEHLDRKTLAVETVGCLREDSGEGNVFNCHADILQHRRFAVKSIFD